MTSDPQAAELSIKFLTQERAAAVVHTVGPRLAQLRKYSAVSLHFLLTLSLRYACLTPDPSTFVLSMFYH